MPLSSLKITLYAFYIQLSSALSVVEHGLSCLLWNVWIDCGTTLKTVFYHIISNRLDAPPKFLAGFWGFNSLNFVWECCITYITSRFIICLFIRPNTIEQQWMLQPSKDLHPTLRAIIPMYLHLKLQILNGAMYYTCVHNRQGGGGVKFVQDLLKIQFNRQFHKFFLFLFS